MKLISLFILVLFVAFSTSQRLSPLQAQTKPSGLLVLSKDASGTILRNLMSLTLRTNPACDQAGEAFPDGSQLTATDLVFNTEDNNLGLVYGSAQISAPDGRVLQSFILRGTYGMNTRREASQGCRFEHLEALLEPVPTFAPVNAPQIALAHLAADMNLEAAGPLPTYRAKLDGVVRLPANMNNRVTITPDKSGYGENELITAVIVNGTSQPITAYDLKSYCSIVKVQRQDGNGWEDLAECFIKRRVLPVTIAAGETKRVVLEPGINANPLKAAGTYRLWFEYYVGEGATATTQAIYTASQTFRVNQIPTRQSVKLQFDKVPEFVGQEIVARLANDGDTAIQTPDHRSECSIFIVQRQVGADWVNVAECQLLTRTRLIKTEAHQSHTVTLQGNGGFVYPPGTYRLEASYEVLDAKGQPQSPALMIYSSEFTLREK